MELDKLWHSTRISWVLLALALLWSLSNLIYSINIYNWPSGDETWHYSYNQRYYDSGETERESVHNYNSTTPVVILNILANKAAEKLTGHTFNKIALRLPHFFWYLILIAGIAALARYLANPTVAWWATFLTLLDPSLNAHAALIGTDVPFSAVSLWLLLVGVYYLKSPNLYKAILLGITYGLCFCVKYSATFLILPLLLVFLFSIIWPNEKGRSSFSKRLAVALVHSLFFVFFVGLVVNSAYSFAGVGSALTIKEWYSAPFKFLLSTIGTWPSPLAIPFLSGFDHQFAAERTWSWNVIILGNLYPSGVWFYFLFLWLVKTPSSVVLLTCLSLFSALKFRTSWKQIKLTWLIVILTWLTLLFYFSVIFRTQVGLRYAFLCLPLGYLLVAGLLDLSWAKITQRKAALLVLIIALFELLPYFGNGIAFTNSFITNKTEAYRYIADSNIDWFHNEQEAKAEATQKLKEFHYDPIHILPGNNLLTLNKLAGVMHNFDQYAWVRKNLTALGHFKHTLLWYYVDKRSFSEYLDQNRTFAESATSRKICVPQYKYKELSTFPAVNLLGNWGKPAALYSGCLIVETAATFEVKLNSGWSIVGNYPNEFDCQGWPGGSGDSLWFRFKPGMHPVCAYVNDTAKIDWTLHDGKAKFALRILP